MGSILTNGVFLPAEGERNCYTGLAANWSALDSLIGGYNAHIGNTTIHVTAADKQAWNGKADASALTAHTGDTTIHVTAEDKQAWDAVTSKANDSDVVHKRGNETVGGQKTFTNSIILQNSDTSGFSPGHFCKSQAAVLGDVGSGDNTKYTFVDKNNNEICYIAQRKFTNSNTNMSFCVKNIDNNNNSISAEINYTLDRNNEPRVTPDIDNYISLGRPTFRWKNIYSNLINGLTPSSLSLPSGNANDVIDISSYITALDGTSNSYTVPANGWISIAITGTAIAIVSSSWSDSRLRASSGNVSMLYPVLKNETVGISVTGTTLAYARFIPCQGNI